MVRNSIYLSKIMGSGQINQVVRRCISLNYFTGTQIGSKQVKVPENEYYLREAGACGYILIKITELSVDISRLTRRNIGRA